MAMSNSNYGFPTPGFSTPYSSTPSNIRTQRPRFGYSGPSLYPRPRSSASKPNPDSFSDSMMNNYNSNSRIDVSFNSENSNSYDSYQQNSSSNYFTANDSFYSNQSNNEDASYMGTDQNNFLRNNNSTALPRDSGPLMYDDYMVRNSPTMAQGFAARGSGPNAGGGGGILPKPTMSQFGSSSYNNSSGYSNSYGLSDLGSFKGNFKKPQPSFGFGDKSNKPPFNRKFGKAKRKMATSNTTTQASAVFRCSLCNLDFKSQIPYDMHLGGARHAKKLKAKEALSAVQLQCSRKSTGQDGEKSYFCDLCNVKANSLLQLHNHLEGSKHKNKLNPKEKTEEGSKESEEKKTTTSAKTNGSLTRPLPPEFGEPQPAKLTKFACETCSISVNSEVQLQQHLSSKKHQNKVEGKPVVKKRKSNLIERTAEETTTPDEQPPQQPQPPAEVVVGVKTLSSSFVLGETLQ